MAVGVGVIVTAGGRSTRIVRFLGVTWAGGTILFNRATAGRGASVPITVLIVVARRSAPAVIISGARAIAARRTASIIVIVIGSRWAAAAKPTTVGRTRPIPVAAPIIGTRSKWSSRLEWGRRGWITDVLSTLDLLALELTTVELLDCSFQVGNSLVLNKSTAKSIVEVSKG